jgi:hypothetical protein
LNSVTFAVIPVITNPVNNAVKNSSHMLVTLVKQLVP